MSRISPSLEIGLPVIQARLVNRYDERPFSFDVLSCNHVDRSRATPTENETAGVGHIFRITLDLFSLGQHVADVLLAYSPTEHALYGMHPEDESHPVVALPLSRISRRSRRWRSYGRPRYARGRGRNCGPAGRSRRA